ncbi:hypothetical protein CEUSTIGMA_g764.t1 [Chlamydomonas eustigma]|uniref:MIF4G domain-containing protein n=1 Tax=Chlamydomonas eustigma TaxID=1157962 RepID=A0A250WRZ0_9CHLO|nr:hypothetical protein CEUSTIGMA_g764.t1 [Chlamydomonas eustigma]|eukprot:GAX73310.1 hypothetical protein CEUSTIGMA_g764.t1 [Chlamydomonas eustigma]
MDQAHKDRLIEEAKQRTFADIIERSHDEKNVCCDAKTLHEEIMKVGLVEAGTVRGLIEHIFNKATADTSSCQTLAELCSLMPAHLEPPESAVPAVKEKGAGSRGSSEKRVDFRLMVLRKCKEELEKGGAAMKAVRQWDSKETAGGKKGGGLKGEEKEQAELDRLAYHRMLGAVQFCGHLYNVGILTEKIIHSAIDAMIKDEADYSRHENMEILSNLLRSIGMKLDSSSRSSKDSKAVAEYFKRVEKIKAEASSKEIAKMMEKVLTLRENHWEEAASAH